MLFAAATSERRHGARLQPRPSCFHVHRVWQDRSEPEGGRMDLTERQWANLRARRSQEDLNRIIDVLERDGSITAPQVDPPIDMEDEDAVAAHNAALDARIATSALAEPDPLTEEEVAAEAAAAEKAAAKA